MDRRTMDRRTMDRRGSAVNWIVAYQEWTSSDGWAFGLGSHARSGFGPVGPNASEAFAVAYLDWVEDDQQSEVTEHARNEA